MKATEVKNLVIGRVYSDIGESLRASFMRYDGCDNACVFTYLGGDEVYGTGSIRFPIDTEHSFYELTPSEIEQYLPREKP